MHVARESRSALARSQLFLRMATECAADERVEFEAFIEATIVFARAALHRFQAQHERDSRWKGWWSGLRGNPSVEFFRAERDWLLKEAPPRIGQRGFAVSIGSSSPGHEPTTAAEFYFFEDSDGPATDTVTRHLQELARVLQSADALFV